MIPIRRASSLLAFTALLAACAKSDRPSSTSAPSSTQPAAASPATASHSAGVDMIDDATLHDYRLDDAKIARTIQANENLAALMKSNPGLEKQMEAMGNAQNDPKTLNELVDRIDAVPPVRTAIERAGISSRDWILTLMTSMSAEMNYQFQKSGLTKKLASTVSPENMSYVAAHRDQMKALTASSQKMNGDTSSANE